MIASVRHTVPLKRPPGDGENIKSLFNLNSLNSTTSGWFGVFFVKTSVNLYFNTPSFRLPRLRLAGRSRRVSDTRQMLTFPARPLGGASPFSRFKRVFGLFLLKECFHLLCRSSRWGPDEREGGSSHLSAVPLRHAAPFRRRLGVQTSRAARTPAYERLSLYVIPC